MSENFEILSKWFIATGSLLTVLLKVLDLLSKERRKKSLSDDIFLIRNILDSDKNNSEIITEELYSKKVQEYLELGDIRFRWFNTLYALFLFVGFGYWTIYLFKFSADFDPWTLLTALVSIVGLGLLLDSDLKTKKTEKRLISIIVLRGITTGIIIFLLSIATIAILMSKVNGYTHWYILPGILLPISIKVVYDSVKINRHGRLDIGDKTGYTSYADAKGPYVGK